MKYVRPVLISLAILVASTGISTSAQAAPRGSHCVADTGTQSVRCFDTEQRAMTAAAGVTVATFYEHGNFGGGSLTVTGDTCRDGQNQNLNFWQSTWNDKVSSFKTYANCYVTFYEHGDFQGATREWYANDAANFDNDFNDKPSSAVFSRGPSRAELLKDCDRATRSCDAKVGWKGNDFWGDWRRVDTAYNCSSSESTQVVGSRDTRTGKNSVSHEIGVTAGFQFLVDWSVSYKATFGSEWGWETSDMVETRTTIKPGHWAGLDRSPVMRVSGGEYELWYEKPKWGHRQWFVLSFSGEGPAPGVVGQTKIVGAKMTAAEKKKVCGKSANEVVRSTGAPVAAAVAPAPVATTAGALHS
ncbi:hypothetical protein [Amycolatopsis sp. NPDC059657]|uniref:hypothetical protein n=1 Tax=Amycolatopsis sp. NPDC059657 TaxID=3346899 RepID=UPI003670EA83